MGETGQVFGRKLDIRNVGGDVFAVREQVSNSSTMWTELFTEGERRLMRQELEEVVIPFMIRENFEVITRSVWQPEAKNRAACLRGGKTAVLLHGTETPHGSGWMLSKLVRSLYTAGFSVVLVDFPGFGNSFVECQSRSWKRHDGYIVAHIMSELGVGKFHVVASGQSFEAFVRLLQSTPNRLEKSHVFLNPIADVSMLFPDIDVKSAVRLEGAQWEKWLREERLNRLQKLLLENSVSFMSLHDEVMSPAAVQFRQDILGFQANSKFLSDSIIVDDVTKEDVCETRMGARVQTRFYVFSKRTKTSIASYLKSPSTRVMYVMPTKSPASSHARSFFHHDSTAESQWTTPAATPAAASNRSFSLPAATPAASSRAPSLATPAAASSRAPSLATPAAASSRAHSLALAAQTSSEAPSRPRSEQSLQLPGSRRPSMLPDTAPSTPARSASAGGLRRSGAEAHIGRSMQEASSRLYAEPRLVRQSLLSRVPQDMIPHDLSNLRPAVEKEVDIRVEELNALEDGADASIEHFIAVEKQRQKYGNDPVLMKAMARPDGKKDPAARRMIWKTVNKAMHDQERILRNEKKAAKAANRRNSVLRFFW